MNAAAGFCDAFDSAGSCLPMPVARDALGAAFGATLGAVRTADTDGAPRIRTGAYGLVPEKAGTSSGAGRTHSGLRPRASRDAVGLLGKAAGVESIVAWADCDVKAGTADEKEAATDDWGRSVAAAGLARRAVVVAADEGRGCVEACGTGSGGVGTDTMEP